MSEMMVGGIVLLVLVWVCQPFIWACKLFVDEYSDRRECIVDFFFWLVPIWPFFWICIKKVMELNPPYERGKYD